MRATASSASAVCGENDDVLLTSADGQAIRFPVTDVRVFKGREFAGVRGIKLEGGDQVISMAILSHIEAAPAERAAYIRQANMIRRGGADVQEPDMEAESNGEETVVLTPERYAELSAHEEFVLTVSENGYGKRTSRLRVPHLRPRRQRHHRHDRQSAERQAARAPSPSRRPTRSCSSPTAAS